MNNLFLYGPPGSGKTTLGELLAARLRLPFLDLDRMIQDEAGRSVARIFADEGEEGFRARERRLLEEAASCVRCVVALGGGTLLDEASRERVERAGTVVCLDCPVETLRARIAQTPGARPLVADDGAAAKDALEALLARRADHYASFRLHLDVAGRSQEDLLDAAEILFGTFRIESGDVPSDIAVGVGLLDAVGPWARQRELGRRAVVVADANTDPLYAGRVAASLQSAGIAVSRVVIPAGEATKNLSTVQEIWRGFLQAGLARDDFAVAVGGGVTGDLTGFAAATWMRGIPWVNVPTTLLAMVDSSTGGKTGCDLPEAKNLIGAFHSPSFVLADAETLLTLPAREGRCGLAEAVKHAFIADPDLANRLDPFRGLVDLPDEATLETLDDVAGVAAFVSRSLAVKVHLVRQDPFEKGPRAKLNLGHTIGHAVEVASNFALKHGEAVAIGIVEEARLAVRLGLAEAGWPECVAQVFGKLGLPTSFPAGMTFDSLVEIMRRDKKKKDGQIRFALPCRWGDVNVTPVDLRR